ncbi:MAG TPA: hypothetical protein PK760_06785, partial [Flavobacteriales bacterium]|nr:hypothetical protein [Flavobacteriales bacterium]
TRSVIAFRLITALTGCITIEEQYVFKKNGSGTMTYIIDMTEMGEMIGGFTKDEDDKSLDNLSMGAHADALKGLAGIGKVKLDTKTKWVQKVTFSFKDVDALNRALNALMPDSLENNHRFFTWENGTLVRSSNSYMRSMSSTMMEGVEMGSDSAAVEEEGGFDLASMLSMMKYKYSFKFAKPIATTEAAEVMVKKTSGAKAVELSTDWSAIAKDPKALDLRIDFGH